MDINRNNYESWFMDYLDGRLNTGQEEILMSFLEFNPDLRTELGGFENLQLEAEDSGYDLKASLRKPVNNPDFRDMLENFEDYCISGIEQQLSTREEKMLQEILEKDKSRKDIYRLYASTRLSPDESLHFPGKSRLKKRLIHVPAARIAIASVAAAAVLLFALPWIFRSVNQQQADSRQMADVYEKTSIEKQSDVKVPGEIRYDPKLDYTGDATDTGPGETKVSEHVFPQEIVLQPETGDSLTIREDILLSRLEPRSASKLEKTTGPTISGSAYRLRSERYYYTSLEELNAKYNDGRDEDKRKKKLSLWRLADAGIQKINDLAEDDYSLEREINEEGKICRLTFETPLFGISTPMRNSNNPQ